MAWKQFETERVTPVHPPPHRGVKTDMNKNLLLRGAFSLAAVATLTACNSSASPASSAPATPSSHPSSATASSAPAAKPLGPLVLGRFSSTTEGRLAKGICKSWQGLRQEYVSKVDSGTTAFDMNQWFSSPAWSTVQSDGMKLGNAPAYSNLETAVGVAITGDLATKGSAAAIDKACKAAD